MTGGPFGVLAFGSAFHRGRLSHSNSSHSNVAANAFTCCRVARNNDLIVSQCASSDTTTPSSNCRSRARVVFKFSANIASSDRDLRSEITFSGGNGSQINDGRASISSIGAGWYNLTD